MIMRTAPSDVSRTRHPLGLAGRPGSRMVPAFTVRPMSMPVARDRAAMARVLD